MSQEAEQVAVPGRGYPAGGDRAGRGAEEERRDQGRRRRRSRRTAGPGRRSRRTCGRRSSRRATRSRPSASSERDEQGGHRRGEGAGKPGPPDHQDVDQPDVVGLPHRADAVVDQHAQLAAALAPPAVRSQKPGAEVGAAEQCVDHDAERTSHGHDVREGQRHAAPAASSTARPVRARQVGSRRPASAAPSTAVRRHAPTVMPR